MAIEPIDYGKCNSCGECVLSCPTDVIRMDKDTKRPAIRYPDDCMGCGLCMIHCSGKAIKVNQKKDFLLFAWG